MLGVDFMSENVRAILDEAGHKDVAVYRMSSSDIGCSLAEAAESDRYMDYLAEAAHVPASLHVVYINTSLRTKALANETVPTITCTSSNVVQTVLQAFAQVPEASVWYGPDTYMGRNLAQLFSSLAECSDEEIRELHPAHTRDSIRCGTWREGGGACTEPLDDDSGALLAYHIDVRKDERGMSQSRFALTSAPWQ